MVARLCVPCVCRVAAWLVAGFVCAHTLWFPTSTMLSCLLFLQDPMDPRPKAVFEKFPNGKKTRKGDAGWKANMLVFYERNNLEKCLSRFLFVRDVGEVKLDHPIPLGYNNKPLYRPEFLVLTGKCLEERFFQLIETCGYFTEAEHKKLRSVRRVCLTLCRSVWAY